MLLKGQHVFLHAPAKRYHSPSDWQHQPPQHALCFCNTMSKFPLHLLPLWCYYIQQTFDGNCKSKSESRKRIRNVWISCWVFFQFFLPPYSRWIAARRCWTLNDQMNGHLWLIGAEKKFNEWMDKKMVSLSDQTWMANGQYQMKWWSKRSLTINFQNLLAP